LREGYCIDTSALIDLHTNHYPPDIFPGLWKDLEFLVDQGLLIAPDEVFQEIRVKDDELAKWGKSNKKCSFLSIAIKAGKSPLYWKNFQVSWIGIRRFPKLILS
jgi:hypothetical protein